MKPISGSHYFLHLFINSYHVHLFINATSQHLPVTVLTLHEFKLVGSARKHRENL